MKPNRTILIGWKFLSWKWLDLNTQKYSDQTRFLLLLSFVANKNSEGFALLNNPMKILH